MALENGQELRIHGEDGFHRCIFSQERLLVLVSDEFIHFADDFEDVHAMALSSLPEIFIIGNEAAYAGHAVFHEEGSHFRIYFNDLHDVVFRTDEIAGRQRRNFRGIPAAVAVEAVGGSVSVSDCIAEDGVTECFIADGINEFFQGLIIFVFEVVGACLDHEAQCICRELCESEECLLAGVNVPAVGHAYRTERKRRIDGTGQNAGRPGAECLQA